MDSERGIAASRGRLLYGRFEILSKLGEGTFGCVWHCFDREARVEVALKQLKETQPDALLRFKHEFRALADVHHPNLVQLGELFEAAGSPWAFSMELIWGCDWLDWVREPGLSAEAAERRLREGILQAARGLGALHRLGLVHRDLKPDNIRVSKQGRVVLLDLGLCARLTPSRHANEHGPMGVPAYIAPEQLERMEGPPADLYALGVILFESLTGVLPYRGGAVTSFVRKLGSTPPPPRERAPRAPEELDRLCQGLLATEPEERPTADDVCRRLGDGPEQADVLVDYRRRHQLTKAFFVGRGRELRELDEQWASARSEGFRLVLLEGSSGIGKTALMEEWLRRQNDMQPARRVLVGRCHPAERVRFKMWDGLMDQLCEHLCSFSPKALSAVLPSAPWHLVRLFPVFSRLGPAVEPAVVPSTPDDPVAERFAALQAVAQLLYGLARETPLVLCIDDVQWADEDSLALLQVLASKAANPGIFCLGTMRELAEFEPRLGKALQQLLARSPDIQRLSIPVLSPDESARMAAHWMGRDERDQSVLRVVEQTAGHPWFASELARRCHEGGEDLTQRSLKQTLRGWVHELGAESSAVLQLVAVAGAPLPVAVVHRALGYPAAIVSQALAVLFGHRLASKSGEGEVVCYHDSVREAVLDELGEAQFRQLSAQLAASCELEGLDALRIAGYWVAAVDPERARPWLVIAANAAEAAGAYAGAAELYGELLASPSAALGTPLRNDLRLKRAEALANAGKLAESAELLVEVIDECPPEHRASLQVQAAKRFLQAGQVRKGLAEAHGLVDAGDAEACLFFAQFCWLDDKRAEAQALARRAERLFDEQQILLGSRSAAILAAFAESPKQGQRAAALHARWLAELGWLRPECALRIFLPLYPLLCRPAAFA